MITDWKQYPNFRSAEFDSPDLPGSGNRMQPIFLEMLQRMRTIAGISFRINSGFRTAAHNRAINGASNSAHLRGVAADIHCTTSRNRSILVRAAIQAGFSRIGIAPTFVHVDCDNTLPGNIIWLY